MAGLSFEGFLNYVGAVVTTKGISRRSIGIRTPSKETVWVTLFDKQVKAIEAMIPLVEATSKAGNKYLKPSANTRVKLENVLEGEFQGKPSYSLGKFGKITIA